jgi:hypothetical protein
MKQLLQSIKDDESSSFSSSGSIIGPGDDNKDHFYEILPPIQKSQALAIKKKVFF